MAIGRTVRLRTKRRYPYLLALAGMLPALAGAACDWSNPGAAPYRQAGDVTAATAVESYRDIPPAARADLADRIRGQREDAIVFIGRDGMTSPQGRATDLRDMHWRGGVCDGPVTRAGWAPDRVEPALVYVSGGHCLLVPVVCGNVARCSFEPREPELKASAPARVNRVPEPSTLLLALVAIPFIRRAAAEKANPRTAATVAGSVINQPRRAVQ